MSTRSGCKSGETELLVPIGDVKAGDEIVVRTGNLIPLDGKVVSGEATVNQASMTGESHARAASGAGSYVYAGTVVGRGRVRHQRRKRRWAAAAMTASST